MLRGQFVIRNSQAARWRAGRSPWWSHEPIVGRPTHRPIFNRALVNLDAAEFERLMEKVWKECAA